MYYIDDTGLKANYVEIHELSRTLRKLLEHQVNKTMLPYFAIMQ